MVIVKLFPANDLLEDTQYRELKIVYLMSLSLSVIDPFVIKLYGSLRRFYIKAINVG